MFRSGKFSIQDMATCTAAQNGKPTLFVKICLWDSVHSAFTGNDVFSFPLDKTKIKCIEGKILTVT